MQPTYAGHITQQAIKMLRCQCAETDITLEAASTPNSFPRRSLVLEQDLTPLLEKTKEEMVCGANAQHRAVCRRSVK